MVNIFFDELESALRYVPDYRKVYDAISQTFKRCLNQLTEPVQVNFSGDFSKTDYLLKEHKASAQLIKTTNDTRVRLRKRHELGDADLQKYCLQDVKNLCLFVAFMYEADVPKRLVAHFPQEEVETSETTLVGECMRVIVERWDDEYVFVQLENGPGEGPTRVCYAHGNTAYDYDWTYLRALFHEGAQLNLVRPRQLEGTLYPELIIYEPDYLVNISTVARCFTNYADSPLVELIKKLEPQETTEAIVLGNLAGQLLDECIHQLPQSHTYAESVKTFFRDNAISLLTTDIGPDFHREAQQQKQHIARAMHETMPATMGRFDSKEGIVEPSFFSEMLGLQGRMDYLQMDFRVLMEQKSGKAGFAPNGNMGKPTLREEHYVQLLLYMALIRYNFSDIYERNGRELQAFLLYSKYDESLLRLGFAPELIFRAFKVRNELTWLELQLTKPNAYRMLDSLNADALNTKKTDGKLWNNFQRPQIERFLAPIHTATELEKAYFFRFLTFIANEHVMSKLGNKTKESSGFAATWHDSLTDKLAAGNIYNELTLVYPDVTGEENSDVQEKATDGTPEGRIETVVLKFSETEDNDMSNFRTGDIVILYPYEGGMKEPDVRRTMVFRCTIEDIGTDTIRLKLRNAQSDKRVFVKERGKMWAIEHDFMESSSSSLYKAMYAFLLAPKERRDLLLLQREPQTDETKELRGEYGGFNDLMLREKRAKDVFLIIGPPGTGKTSFGLLNTVKEELLEPDGTILLMSYTNRAVDEICSKLAEHDIDFIRIGNAMTCAEEYRDKLLSTRAQESANLEQLRTMLVSTRVVVGTTSTINSHIQLFRLKQFSLAVIDEASQILEPHLVGLFSAHIGGKPAIKKFVLIGDHKQLPAVVQQREEVSRVEDTMLNDIFLTDCRLSLFERFLRKYGKNEDVTSMLTRQGRMHHDIALFPSQTFYANRLQEVPLPHQNAPLHHSLTSTSTLTSTSSLPHFSTSSLPHSLTSSLPHSLTSSLLTSCRIAFLNVEAPLDSPSDKVNQAEAEIIAAIVVKAYEMHQEDFDVTRTVGVIVPYRNQIAAVRKAIDRYDIPLLHNITIDTVERYQGSQRKIIIYGFTIQRYYQLSFLTDNVFADSIDGSLVDRKLNVAMTRAEEQLIMVGNAKLLSTDLTFSKLIEFVRSKQCFFEATN